MSRAVARPIVVAALFWSTVAPLFAQDTPPPPPAPIVQHIEISGVRELSRREVLAAARAKVGDALPDTPENLARDIQTLYEDNGYRFARVTALFDATTATLGFVVNEGVIQGVEFVGIDEALARRLQDDFALKAGDTFNGPRAKHALTALLRPTRGAVAPAGDPFDLVDRDGARWLTVRLREPAGRFRLAPNPGEREDWFTAVDGFVPSFGMLAAVFDHERFNHAFVAGHLSIKTATGRVGYALGFEKPLLKTGTLFVGGELHDLTATDDDWRVSSLEASLAAIGPRRSFHDYYRRNGVQLNVAYRPHRRVELLFAWRAEHHSAMATDSDFSFWNGDEAFRPNLAAADGRLNAVVLGASYGAEGFDRESLEASYRRHQLETPFGERLGPVPDNGIDWRVDWRSEVSSPGALSSDFDFTRSIVSARMRTMLSPHQEFGARAIAGWSSGVLPPQREFAVGGIGSVHGYEFKEETGSGMTLLNVEYALGWRSGLRTLGFFDAGRATTAAGDAAWLRGVGFGFAIGEGIRVDFGYRLDAVPSSLQVLFRFGRTF